MRPPSRRSVGALAAVAIAGAGCSLAHDFEGLATEATSGAGGAGGGPITTAHTSGASGSAAISASAAETTVGSSSSGACVPSNSCATISPAYTGDDGCGTPLQCGCDQGSVPDPASGTCVCTGSTIASQGAHPQQANQINGHQVWSGANNITEGATGSASVSLNDGQLSNHLQARGFDLGLPVGATVRHIRATVCERQTGSGVRDEHVRLLFDNQTQGADAKRDQSWPMNGTCQPRDYDWPVAPNTTPLNYDASVFQGGGFGIQVQVSNSGPNASTAHVGYVTIHVDYEPACTPHAF